MVQYKYIIQAIEKSYSHKPHLADLPYDLNTNDPEKLKERLKACKRGLKEAKQDLKDMQENLEFNESLIEESENNIKSLEDENNKLAEKNAGITETIGKVYDHFEEVTMLSEEDGWEIKKIYDKWKENQYGYDISELDERMKTFIDDVTLQGYMPDGYAQELDELIGDIYGYGDLLAWDNKTDAFPELNEQLKDSMTDYLEKYDISKDTPLTQKLNKIESDGNLSDLWDRQLQSNDKKIKRNNEYIEGNKKEIERLTPRHSEIKREVAKLETKVKDFETHQQSINEKLDKLKE